MHTTCLLSPSARRRSPTARAVCPPMPASISSNTSVPIAARSALSRRRPPPSPAAEAVMTASITRESSPPEAISRNGPAGTPRVGSDQQLHRIAAAGPRRALGERYLELRIGHRQRGQLLAHALGQARSGRVACLTQLRHVPIQLGRAPLRCSSVCVRRLLCAVELAPDAHGHARRRRARPRSSRRACEPVARSPRGALRRPPESRPPPRAVPHSHATPCEILRLHDDRAQTLSEPVQGRGRRLRLPPAAP